MLVLNIGVASYQALAIVGPSLFGLLVAFGVRGIEIPRMANFSNVPGDVIKGVCPRFDRRAVGGFLRGLTPLAIVFIASLGAAAVDDLRQATFGRSLIAG